MLALWSWCHQVCTHSMWMSYSASWSPNRVGCTKANIGIEGPCCCICHLHLRDLLGATAVCGGTKPGWISFKEVTLPLEPDYGKVKWLKWLPLSIPPWPSKAKVVPLWDDHERCEKWPGSLLSWCTCVLLWNRGNSALQSCGWFYCCQHCCVGHSYYYAMMGLHGWNDHRVESSNVRRVTFVPLIFILNICAWHDIYERWTPHEWQAVTQSNT